MSPRKPRDEQIRKVAESVAGFCHCAGPTCSGCETQTIDLFTRGANWADSNREVMPDEPTVFFDELQWAELNKWKSLAAELAKELEDALKEIHYERCYHGDVKDCSILLKNEALIKYHAAVEEINE